MSGYLMYIEINKYEHINGFHVQMHLTQSNCRNHSLALASVCSSGILLSLCSHVLHDHIFQLSEKYLEAGLALRRGQGPRTPQESRQAHTKLKMRRRRNVLHRALEGRKKQHRMDNFLRRYP